MRRVAWHRLISIALAILFLIAGVMNLFPSPELSADYARWGYPAWFSRVTGLLELLAALMLLLPAFRMKGILLGGMIAAAALCTLLLNGELAHALAPLLLLAGLAAAALLVRRHQIFSPQGTR